MRPPSTVDRASRPTAPDRRTLVCAVPAALPFDVPGQRRRCARARQPPRTRSACAAAAADRCWTTGCRRLLRNDWRAFRCVGCGCLLLAAIATTIHGRVPNGVVRFWLCTLRERTRCRRSDSRVCTSPSRFVCVCIVACFPI